MDSSIFILSFRLESNTPWCILWLIMYFVAQMFPLWPLGAPLSLSHTPIIVVGFLLCFVVFCLALPYLLALQDAPGSPCTFSVPALEPAPSPRCSRAIFHKEIEFLSQFKRVRVQTRRAENKAEWRGWWKLADGSAGHPPLRRLLLPTPLAPQADDTRVKFMPQFLSYVSIFQMNAFVQNYFKNLCLSKTTTRYGVMVCLELFGNS